MFQIIRRRTIRDAPADPNIVLGAGTITGPDGVDRFDIDPVRAQKLMNGWGDIKLTRAHRAEIDAFAAARRAAAPWVWP